MIANIIICAFFALVGFVAGCAFAMPFQLIKISIEPGEEDAPEEKANPTSSETPSAIPTTDDYIDWSKVPEEYDWVAIDGPEFKTTKKIWAYNNKNKNEKMLIVGDSWGSESRHGSAMPLDESDAIIGPLPPWRESLRHRPGIATQATNHATERKPS